MQKFELTPHAETHNIERGYDHMRDEHIDDQMRDQSTDPDAVLVGSDGTGGTDGDEKLLIEGDSTRSGDNMLVRPTPVPAVACVVYLYSASRGGR